MLGKLHDGAMIVFADATMLCAHVYRPSTVHLPTSNCILCGNTTLVQTEHCPQPKRAMLSVLPIATSSDLDLQSTNSNAVRQLCILGLDAITNSKTEQTILRFVSDLTLHVGYTVAHQRVQTTRTFHVLTLFFTSDKEQTHNWKEWLRSTVVAYCLRTVIIAPLSMTRFFNETFAECSSSNLTFIYFADLQYVTDVLLHSSLIAKHRVVVKNLHQVDVRNELTVVSSHPTRAGCLFF